MPGFRGWGPSAGELKRRLAEDCERVVEAVLPDCQRKGSELRGHGQDGALWVIGTHGRKRGVALCVAGSAPSGDLLDLVTHALCGGDRSAAWRWAVQYFGGAVHRPAPAPPSPRDLEQANETEAAKRKRLWGWYEGALRGAGSPVEAYLDARGLSRAIIELPEILRFSPRCRYVYDKPSGRWTHHPAMLAPVVDPISGAFLALHCTYLEQIGGLWRKVSTDPARKCWSRYMGGVIELSSGASGKPLRDAAEGDGCLIAEGIENALSAAFLRPELRALAAVSVVNIPKVSLPSPINRVVLVCDDDGEQVIHDETRERGLIRWRHEGRSTEKMVPIRGYKDINDQLQKELGL